ncbi:flagellar type III secretion system protein FlhB [bacterium]|nr:flagellar type III secretion system protein FlhB [bacterium]
MSGGDEDGEKSHEPSQKRLEEARKRGDVPRSMDLATSAVYGGAALAISVAGTKALGGLGASAIGLIDHADRMSQAMVEAGRAPTMGLLVAFGLPILPLFLFPLGAAVLAIALQRGFIIAPERIAPKLSRISPIKAMGQKFGREGLFNFAKNLIKLVVVCCLVAGLALQYADPLMMSPRLSAGQTGLLMTQIIRQFLFLAFLVSLIFGAIDYGWQWLQHRHRNMMTRQEVVEENRDNEGDPHMKGHRRQKGREIAMAQMLQDVAKADVILVNPTHYAVALKWRRGDRTAPICLAKGVDDIAARIREKASEAGVPIHRDPATARAIYATVEIGDPIRPEHFKSVAAAIRFAEAMRKRAKGRKP